MRRLLLALTGVSMMMTVLPAQDLTVCAGKGYTLTSTADASGTSPVTYEWLEDGMALPSSNSASYTIAEGRAVAGDYAYVRVAANAACTLSSNTFTVTVNPVPDPPAAVATTLCFGLSGQLTAQASGASVAWYDAPTGGTSLYVGNVLPLPLLYNNTAVYYAEAVSEHNCVSNTRTAAPYTIYNCAVTGDCPAFTGGSVGANTPVAAACAAFYPGQIGPTDYPVACVAFDAGRIGQ
jgi:hypothetical protein